LKINVHRTKLHNLINRHRKEYKDAVNRMKDKLKGDTLLFQDCEKLMGRFDRIRKHAKRIHGKDNPVAVVDYDQPPTSESSSKDKQYYTLQLLEAMSSRLEDMTKCVMALDKKIGDDMNEIAQVNKTLHTIESGVKADLAKLSGRPSFIYDDGSIAYEAEYTLKHHPIVFYNQMPLQNKIIFSKQYEK
jgi:hypothetical protein